MSARFIAPAPAIVGKALDHLAAASATALRVLAGALAIVLLLVAGLGATFGSALLPAAATLAQALGQRLAWNCIARCAPALAWHGSRPRCLTR